MFPRTSDRVKRNRKVGPNDLSATVPRLDPGRRLIFAMLAFVFGTVFYRSCWGGRLGRIQSHHSKSVAKSASCDSSPFPRLIWAYNA